MIRVIPLGALVFPAHAGMSLIQDERLLHLRRFPRSRGDEPAQMTGYIALAVFSPLTRG